MIKYWGGYIGGTDDSLTLADYLYDKGKEELPLSEIFADTSLDNLTWDFRATPELGFTDSDGFEHDFCYAIDLVTDLAALLLECRTNGSFDLKELFGDEAHSRFIRITATAEEYDAMDQALADFAADPLAYDLHELVPDEDMAAMALDCESIRRELRK